MSILSAAEDFAVGRITFPATNMLFNRRGIIKSYVSLLKSERFSQDELRALQFRRLKSIVAFVERHCPYYREKMKNAGIVSTDIQSFEDFDNFPALTRQEVIDHHHELLDERLYQSAIIADSAGRAPGEPIPFARFKRHRIVRNTSSGSTGSPTVFYEDGSATAVSWANELRLRKWFGLSPGVREARMAKLSTDYRPRDKSIILRRKLWHQYMLPGINLTEKDLEFCAVEIEAFKPQVLWGYPSALAGFAEYLYKNGRSLAGGPALAVTWAGPLYAHEEREIARGLKCAITNIYGSREVGHVAFRCPDGALHINQESVLVEHEGEKEDTAGELLVSTLWPSPMPFIKYRMGDLGTVAPSGCNCGRSLQVLENFLGRTGEVFISADGRMISPNFWCRTFMDEKRSKAVKRFQVVYGKDGAIRIRIVKNPSYTLNTERDLLSFIRENLPGNGGISFEYVENIEAQVSGKYQMVVTE